MRAFPGYASSDTSTLDLGCKCRDLFPRLNACPDGSAAGVIEAAQARQSQLKRLEANPAERFGDVLGAVAINFADEAQGQVQLLVALPAQFGTLVHRVDQDVADDGWGSDANEQSVHRHRIVQKRPPS